MTPPPRHGQVFRHPIPAIIAPPKRRCIVFYVPDDWDHIAVFWGTVRTLIYWWNWERDEDHLGTEVAQVWREVFLDARERFLRGECGEDCPPEPEPPPQPPQPPSTHRGGAQTVGALGYTIEELEGLLMGSVMDIRIYQGKLQVQYFPCCDWVDVGSIAGIAQQVAAGAASTSIVDAIEQGIEGFAPVTVSPPVQPGFNNATTRQCAKATAMKYVLQTYLVDMRDYLDSAIGDLTLIIAGVLAAIWLTPFGKLIPQGILSQLVSQFGKDNLINYINDFLADEALWNDFVCTVANDLSTADEVTGQDITTFYQWMLTNAIIAHEQIAELVSKLTFTEFQGNVAYATSYVGCDCDEYLPAGYLPPQTTEVTIAFKEFGYGVALSNNGLGNIQGYPYSQIYQQGRTGEIVTGRPQGVFVGTDTGGGGGTHYNSRMTFVIEASSQIHIDEIKLQLAYPDGDISNAGSNAEIYYMMLRFDPTGQVWDGAQGTNWNPVGVAIDPAPVEIQSIQDRGTSTIWAIHIGARNTGSYRRVRLANMLITGTIIGSGNGFVDQAVVFG